MATLHNSLSSSMDTLRDSESSATGTTELLMCFQQVSQYSSYTTEGVV